MQRDDRAVNDSRVEVSNGRQREGCLTTVVFRLYQCSFVVSFLVVVTNVYSLQKMQECMMT